MKRHDRICALVVIAAGLYCAYYGLFELTLGTMARPDAGFMPCVSGVFMALFGLGWFLQSLGRDEEYRPFWEKGAWMKPLLLLVLLILYAACMEWLGYILSTLLFMAGWQFLIEREKWWKGALISVLSTAGVYVLFVYLLSVPVPAGRLLR